MTKKVISVDMSSGAVTTSLPSAPPGSIKFWPITGECVICGDVANRRHSENGSEFEWVCEECVPMPMVAVWSGDSE